MASIKVNSPAREALNEWKSSPGIAIRGGNRYMSNDIFIPLSKDMLIQMGFLKEGEEPNADTAKKVQSALDIELRKDPGDRFGPDYYMTLSIGDISKEYKIESSWYSQSFGSPDSFIRWMRNTHLTIRPEEIYESAMYAEARGGRSRKPASEEKYEGKPPFKITDVKCDKRWVAEVGDSGILISCKINGVPCQFPFGAARWGKLIGGLGIDCDVALFPGARRGRWPERERIATGGGGQNYYALFISDAVVTSQPKENQKDFRFIGRLYSTAPIVKAFKPKLMELYDKDLLTQKFLERVGATEAPAEEARKGKVDWYDLAYWVSKANEPEYGDMSITLKEIADHAHTTVDDVKAHAYDMLKTMRGIDCIDDVYWRGETDSPVTFAKKKMWYEDRVANEAAPGNAKSGSLDINSGYDAYYELAGETIVLEVSMKLSANAVGASGGAIVEAPYTNEKISIALQNAALKAIRTYIQNDLKSPASDGGASTKKVRYEVDLAAHKLSYERHFNGAAANILTALGED